MFSRTENGKYKQIPLQENYSSDDEDDFVQRSIKNQQQLMKRQDEGLEMLGQSAHRLTEMSMGIHDELNQQDKMLDEMEQDLDRATDSLDLVTAQTRELVKRAGGKQNCMIICCLAIVALVLFFLVLYT